ncbi:hypothetical protein HTV45_04875 [Streptomyces sp. CHD11]|uniref:hypothetical protein n=1 Tax=Streptomyces sp. CHD11 TaxID=2741325 RepID=UPI001BFBFBFB|nr:hypothetical protein [Streptomyces sp. CHD11]MBT3150227.1 hypothetical protein [Streptomyces sp. CHD11]
MRRKDVRDHGGDDVEGVLDELYAVPPSEFVARREERAASARTAGRADDARRIHAARRPTHAAWAANLLRRSRPDEAERFLELGRALREAHATLDPDGLRELSAQRRRIVSELSRQAAGLAREAGHPLSDTVQRDVETTLRAVLADPQAADLWATGRTESTLTPPSGFPAETAAARAPARKAPRAPSAPARKKDQLAEQRAKRLLRAREAAAAAGERLRDRLAERADAEAALKRAREDHRAAGERVSALEERLRETRAGLERAEQAQREAERRDRTAVDALAEARREADSAAGEAERAERDAR